MDYDPDGPLMGDARITEAEYRAWAEHRMQEVAGELTGRLPGWAREAGLHFEWSTPGTASGLEVLKVAAETPSADGSGAPRGPVHDRELT